MRAMRVQDPTIPRCRSCSTPLHDDYGERECSGCRERVRCQDEAWEASQRLGLWVKWGMVRDRGLLPAIEEARQRKAGVDPEVLEYERQRWVAGEDV